jgi:hypothetical protein
VGIFPVGNIYAPPWMSISPSIAGYTDIEFDIDLPTVTVQPSSILSNQTLQLDGDYDFLVREIQFVVFPVADESFEPSDLRARIRDPFGRLITSDFIQVQNLNGALAIVWGLKRQGQVTFDFQNVNAENAISVQTILKGWKRKISPGAPAIRSPYVPMYRRYALPIDQGVHLEDYEYPFTFTASGPGDLLRVPLPIEDQADFLWRGITGDFNSINNDVAVVGSVGLRFYDYTGTPLSIVGLTNPWGSPNVGQFRESILSSGGGRPAPMYPEILIPKGGAAEVDLSFGAAATVRFSLRGMNIYREACL